MYSINITQQPGKIQSIWKLDQVRFYEFVSLGFELNCQETNKTTNNNKKSFYITRTLRVQHKGAVDFWQAEIAFVMLKILMCLIDKAAVLQGGDAT